MSTPANAATRHASDIVAVVDDPLFDEHSPGVNHPERPARLHAARAGLARSAVPCRTLPPADATRPLLEAVHRPEYVDALERLRGRRGMLDPDTYVAPHSIDAAFRAAGGCALLGESLARGEASHGIALVRPPGHHAEPDRAMGFCLLNNVAFAAVAARANGVDRVAIVDIDVHHGNGTQTIFWRDPRVLYISIHQSPFYPGTGAVEERGEGDGLGTTVNVPLSEGADDHVYNAAMDEVVLPCLRALGAGLILVSIGFDALERDPLAGMRLTSSGYAEMVGAISELAHTTRTPVALVLEGGYDLAGLEECMTSSTRALVAGGKHRPSGAIDPRHRAQIERAAEEAAASRVAWKTDAPSPPDRGER